VEPNSRRAIPARSTQANASPSVKKPARYADSGQVALHRNLDPHTGSAFWTGDESADLLPWLTALTDCPAITEARVLRCEQEDREFCGFVQADPRSGVARRRCVACAAVTDLLDSTERWSYPATYECPGCQQSLVELAVGVSDAPIATRRAGEAGAGRRHVDAPIATRRAGEAGAGRGHVADDGRRISWVAMAARCVGCGRIAGLTDRLVSGITIEELLVAV
jgi:hypothetical protein